MKSAGCIRIFEEKESGRAGTKRPALDAALNFLRTKDQLLVWKIDRLGRSLREMLDTAHMLQERGVKLRTLTEQVDSETATGRMMFDFLGAIAEYFLDLNRERTHGGRKGGRPRRLSDAELAAGRAMIDAGTIPIAEIAKRLGVSARTFYTYFPQVRARSQAHPKS